MFIGFEIWGKGFKDLNFEGSCCEFYPRKVRFCFKLLCFPFLLLLVDSLLVFFALFVSDFQLYSAVTSVYLGIEMMLKFTFLC